MYPLPQYSAPVVYVALRLYETIKPDYFTCRMISLWLEPSSRANRPLSAFTVQASTFAPLHPQTSISVPRPATMHGFVSSCIATGYSGIGTSAQEAVLVCLLMRKAHRLPVNCRSSISICAQVPLSTSNHRA